MKKYITMLAVLLVAAGCTNDKPRPETIVEAAAVENVKMRAKDELIVKHEVRGSTVYIECFVPNYRFSSSSDTSDPKEGFIKLWIDGKQSEEIFTAAFMMKNVPKGYHTITVEFVSSATKHTEFKQTFEIHL
ncbi:hypothetical protein GJU40_05900 [Bacillus lacus]|uniref:Lipoprotein n=1 Tax=Metabacillus lacus TaxID=1983721 RepID=A0A7X2LZ96_9BACI|nr:hypothetical protein [Metabacillus lacus]MRX71707.1 hypothetical protein [Metabacillus lacus]